MINANELRIGNKVLYDTGEGKELCTIDGIDIGGIASKKSYAKDHYPILLAPEILEQCGFCGIDDDGGYGHNICNNLFLENRYLSNDGYDVMLGKKQICLIPITSLHQLQNLYFALTGTELNYKPH